MTSERLRVVRAALAGNACLLGVFDAVLGYLADRATAVAVGGSAARGEIDRYSDLDLLVVTADEAGCAARRAGTRAFLRARYTLIALFDAAHLGLPCLDSAFVVADGRIVKLDVTFWCSTRGPAPVGGVVVHDPSGLAVPAEPAPPEIERAAVDLPGWTCHVRKIIARGELFEAAHCINHMRRHFLVPVLLEIAGLPQVNYRRIEARLPVADLAALDRTYPRELAGPELRRALRALVDAFMAAHARLKPGQRSVPHEDLTSLVALAMTTPVG